GGSGRGLALRGQAVSLGEHLFACQIYTHPSANAFILRPVQPPSLRGGNRGKEFVMNRTAVSAVRLLVASGLGFFGGLCLGLSAAFAAGGPTVDQVVNGLDSNAFMISTSQPNELILIAADGWPCVGGQQVTVDGSPATLIAAEDDCGNNTGGATVFQ